MNVYLGRILGLSLLSLLTMTGLSFASDQCSPLIISLNAGYLERHTDFELAMQRQYLGLDGRQEGEMEEAQNAYNSFITDPQWIPEIETELKRSNLTEQERVALEGLLRFFKVNAISNPEAKQKLEEVTALEQSLQAKIDRQKFGYTDPKTGEFVEAKLTKLRLLVRTNPDEAIRAAAYEGLLQMERFIISNGFVDIIKARNKFAQLMGYSDFYAWKVQTVEGFSKERLFSILEDLEKNSREAADNRVAQLKRSFGPGAVLAHNFGFASSGDLTAEMDPYFPFDQAMIRWGRTFAALGVDFNGAELKIDLVNRDTKYQNGFMRAPFPGYLDIEKGFLPSSIYFTANAIPGQMGSGYSATGTLFHEGGHAAHFSGVKMPSPVFVQENAPTSVAMAELQAMFMDSLMTRPFWLKRYAKDRNGKEIPRTLIEKSRRQQVADKAHGIRSMLAVPFAERELYEMEPQDLTPEKILEVFRRIEKEMYRTEGSGRPIGIIPHIISSESSAYYHGYVLAEMGVDQTYAFFSRKFDGHVVDNPSVGREMARLYWRPGNSISFMQFVENMTGQPFSAEATIAEINMTEKQIDEDVEHQLFLETTVPEWNDPVEMNVVITMIHGDEVIASNESRSFEAMSELYAQWILSLEP